MGIMWFLLGVLTSGSAWFVVSWAGRQKTKPSVSVWAGIVLTILTGLFTIAWSGSSLFKGETQSASMGVIVFGGITLLLFIITTVLNRRFQAKITSGTSKGISS